MDRSIRVYRWLLWLNGGAFAILLLLVLVLFKVRDGVWISLPLGKKLAAAACLLNLLLFVYTSALMLWRLLRRLWFRAAHVRYPYWLLAVGYLSVALLWGFVWWWMAANQPRKWWG